MFFLFKKYIMARRKKEQKVELVNKSGAKTLLSLEHANKILSYQKRKGSKSWEVSPESDYQYHDKDGIIKKPNTETSKK